MTKRKTEFPLAAIVRLVQYLDPSEQREHFEDMQRNGEDITNHVWLSIKAVMPNKRSISSLILPITG